MKNWENHHACLAFIAIPGKPWPFGNEHVSTCDFNPYVVHRLELVEGKDRHEQLGVSEFEEMGKTVGTMMRLTKPM